MIAIPDPVVIAVFPRWSEAVDISRKICHSSSPPSYAIAVPESPEEAQGFRAGWSDDTVPLLLFPCYHREAVTRGVEAVQEIANQHPMRPVGILLSDGPEVCGFKEGRRAVWNRSFAREVSRKLPDVQVFEFVFDWEENPPRIR